MRLHVVSFQYPPISYHKCTTVQWTEWLSYTQSDLILELMPREPLKIPPSLPSGWELLKNLAAEGRWGKRGEDQLQPLLLPLTPSRQLSWRPVRRGNWKRCWTWTFGQQWYKYKYHWHNYKCYKFCEGKGCHCAWGWRQHEGWEEQVELDLISMIIKVWSKYDRSMIKVW